MHEMICVWQEVSLSCSPGPIVGAEFYVLGLGLLFVPMQIFSCVDESLNLVDCSSVCVVHDCTPQGREACRNSIIYKISPVRTGPPSACKDKFRVCKEKSGTCVPP